MIVGLQVSPDQIAAVIWSHWAWLSGSHLGLPSGSPGFKSDCRTEILQSLSFNKRIAVLQKAWNSALEYSKTLFIIIISTIAESLILKVPLQPHPIPPVLSLRRDSTRRDAKLLITHAFF